MRKLILFVLAIYFTGIADAQTVTTYAGTGDPGYSVSNTSMLSAKFDNPYGVAIDSKGRAFVTDMNNQVVIELSNGKYNRRSGDFGAAGYVNTGEGQPRHANPMGVVTGEKDTIFVVDNGSNTIRRIQIPASGSLYPVYTIAGGGPSGGSGASGYTDDKGTNARFNNPVGIAISPNKDYLLVADKGNEVIRKIVIKGTDYGKVTTFAGTAGMAGSDDGAVGTAKFNAPEGVFIDANGDVYVAESMGGIRKISGGVVSTEVAGTPDNLFTSVVKVGSALYIADGCAIRRKDLSSGNVTVFAGSETECDDADGIVDEKLFFIIGGMAVSPDGYLLVADQYNNRIAKVTIPESTVSIKDVADLKFNVYPNPAQNRITVSGIQSEATISLCDLAGRVIRQEITANPTYTMQVGDVATGMYLVKIANAAGTATERVMISR